MLTDTPRWSHARGNGVVPSRWQATLHMPKMSVASIDQRGGAPATNETDLPSPLNSNPGAS